MEAETVPSLSPLIIGADQWHEFLLLLPLLVALEAILSADNAIALAAISRRLHNPLKQRQALNVGLLLALVLRLLGGHNAASARRVLSPAAHEPAGDQRVHRSSDAETWADQTRARLD